MMGSADTDGIKMENGASMTQADKKAQKEKIKEIKASMSEADKIAVKNMIDQIWMVYDTDKSGALDEEETKVFVMDIMKTIGKDGLTDEQFTQMFNGFDEDGSGCVEKGEMLDFILMLMGNS